MKINEIRQELLSRLCREKNGAVVDAINALVPKSMFNYGVSLPTIKTIVMQYKGNHELALNLFESNIRELKLSAIYIDDPKLLTMQQVIKWSETLKTLELVENVTFALFSRSEIVDEIIEYWAKYNDNQLLVKGIELLKIHAKRFAK